MTGFLVTGLILFLLTGTTKITDTTGQAGEKQEDVSGAKVITTLKGSMGERITKALHKVEEKKKKRAERRAQVSYRETGLTHEPQLDKTNKMICAPSEDSDQPGHPPSLIRVFAVRMKKGWVLCYPLSAQRRLWSDLEDAQADPSLRWAHRQFCWFCPAAAQLAKCTFICNYAITG